MKLVTEENMTVIPWGSSTDFVNSWIYQWLNEDFYDSLYNPSSIIEESTWNYSTGDMATRPETIANQDSAAANVGLLNAYEVYRSYQNT